MSSKSWGLAKPEATLDKVSTIALAHFLGNSTGNKICTLWVYSTTLTDIHLTIVKMIYLKLWVFRFKQSKKKMQTDKKTIGLLEMRVDQFDSVFGS